jgi:hypothetical protein
LRVGVWRGAGRPSKQDAGCSVEPAPKEGSGRAPAPPCRLARQLSLQSGRPWGCRRPPSMLCPSADPHTHYIYLIFPSAMLLPLPQSSTRYPLPPPLTPHPILIPPAGAGLLPAHPSPPAARLLLPLPARHPLLHLLRHAGGRGAAVRRRRAGSQVWGEGGEGGRRGCVARCGLGGGLCVEADGCPGGGGGGHAGGEANAGQRHVCGEGPAKRERVVRGRVEA